MLCMHPCLTTLFKVKLKRKWYNQRLRDFNSEDSTVSNYPHSPLSHRQEFPYSLPFGVGGLWHCGEPNGHHPGETTGNSNHASGHSTASPGLGWSPLRFRAAGPGNGASYHVHSGWPPRNYPLLAHHHSAGPRGAGLPLANGPRTPVFMGNQLSTPLGHYLHHGGPSSSQHTCRILHLPRLHA